MYRIGTGYDAHRLEAGRPLILGGVSIPHPTGLLGHSDADVLLHAIADALLGAVALGDLGNHFPPSDPALSGISSSVMLQKVVGLVCNMGWVPINLDSTIIAEAPRLNPHIPAMRDHLANLLQLPPDCVSVKATTCEGMGFTGKKEGIAAQAVVMLGRADRS